MATEAIYSAPVRVFNPRDLSQVKRLIGSIPLVTVVNFRDRAIIGLMGYARASPDEIIGMVVKDYFSGGPRRWVRLAENGIERHKIVERKLQHYIDEYLVAAKINVDPPCWPLFRLTVKRGKRLSARPLSLSALRLAIRGHLANQYECDIEEKSLVELRDRAIIGMFLYASLPSEKISRMRRRDYYVVNAQPYLRVDKPTVYDRPSGSCISNRRVFGGNPMANSRYFTLL